MTGNPDLIDLDRFRLTTDPKKGAAIFEFYNGNDRWVPLTKQTGEFFTPKTLRNRFFLRGEGGESKRDEKCFRH